MLYRSSGAVVALISYLLMHYRLRSHFQRIPYLRIFRLHRNAGYVHANAEARCVSLSFGFSRCQNIAGLPAVHPLFTRSKARLSSSYSSLKEELLNSCRWFSLGRIEASTATRVINEGMLSLILVPKQPNSFHCTYRCKEG